ncbi:ABC transporter substrate-binding protein [Kitasatospora phosalacinea]|uniref:ABC transporter substrate-binding protein n=1 Tax=Kitasatospora phosalacinea TaxID=2065 RepID=A0A9W6Q6I1_9ACTN|nr:ABC transporter substrate-binding protein [Kitasatospora phosalacinea]GLW70837.1 ABC transporter substrate-binding protein [Kitasatospora phosalacinea]
MLERTSKEVDRRGFLRLVGALTTATAIAGSVAACGGPSSTAAGSASDGGAKGGSDGTIEAGISYALSTGFDPMTSSGATPVAANLHVFEGLVDLDPATREPYPALATAMPQQVDDTTWRAQLRSGATFHDGSPVTAEDVVFSFTRVLDPANSSLIVQFLPFLEQVTAVDASTVEFRLKYAFPLFATRISVVKVVPKKVVEADQKAFDAKPTGSGPYQVVEATRQDKIVFRRHDAYNGPRPARAASMVWRLTSDPTARVSSLVSGRVRAIEDVPYVDVAGLKGKATTESVESFGNLFLMFNFARKPFDDKRVRQALHYALDVDKIVATAMYGNGTASTSYLQPSHPDYHRAATVYGHDPEKAKALLTEAGASGLSVTLLTTNTGWVNDIAPLIKESWDAIGVRTTLDIGDSSGQYKKVDAGDFGVMAAPGDPSVFGNDVDLLLRWFYGAGVWTTKRFRWDGSPEDRQVRDLLDQAARTADPAARSALWNRTIDLIAEQAVLYPVVHRKLPTAWNGGKLAGFKPLPTTGLSFLGVSAA